MFIAKYRQSSATTKEVHVFNKVMLIGRLGKDPELRYAASGMAMVNLRVATDESYTDRNGNKVDRTEWHTVVVFQRQAENCASYLRKGSLVFVEGSLQTRKWQDPQGQDRYVTEVKASRVQFLDRKNEQTNQAQYNKQITPGPASEGNANNNGVFPSEASAMDVMPWDMPSPQHQQSNYSGGGEEDVPF